MCAEFSRQRSVLTWPIIVPAGHLEARIATATINRAAGTVATRPSLPLFYVLYNHFMSYTLLVRDLK